MPKIIIEVEAIDINERDVAEALKSYFPNMSTSVIQIRPTPRAPELSICTCNVFMPSGESTSPICRFCSKPPIR